MFKVYQDIDYEPLMSNIKNTQDMHIIAILDIKLAMSDLIIIKMSIFQMDLLSTDITQVMEYVMWKQTQNITMICGIESILRKADHMEN